MFRLSLAICNNIILNLVMLKYLYYRFYKNQGSKDEEAPRRAFSMFFLFLMFNIYTIIGLPFLILHKPVLKSDFAWLVPLFFIVYLVSRYFILVNDKFNLIIKQYEALPRRKNQLDRFFFIAYMLISLVLFFVVGYNVRQIAIEMGTFY